MNNNKLKSFGRIFALVFMLIIVAYCVMPLITGKEYYPPDILVWAFGICMTYITTGKALWRWENIKGGKSVSLSNNDSGSPAAH